MAAALALAAAQLAAAAVPSTMQAVLARGAPCSEPDWKCISVGTVPTPRPAAGELLIEVHGSSVNPVDLDLVEPQCSAMEPPFHCSNGTIGSDVAGVVAQIGAGCGDRLKVGDRVYAVSRRAYADYAVATCEQTSIVPAALSLVDAGTLPIVLGTSYQCLQATGAPWNRTGLTVAITSGSGGTGFTGIQLAKAFGAARVVTAATGDGIAFVRSLGADEVVDYTKQDLFDALPDNSVDIVYDNYGAPGTADKAMPKIRTGGVFLVLEGGHHGGISKHPKPGVKQVPFGLADGAHHKWLDAAGELFSPGAIKPHTEHVYTFEQVAAAWTESYQGKILGKVAVVPSAKRRA
eukprot:TRINITY_DN1516_c0_g2_i1.p2 TRINITY_DN1516_c0_g2~~TRINITY_DN1516_c0_g2_i1.p2  ORF type:complete len:374 (+),score=134.79 TRINITY_DN1516_c0_g2_i1:81-1124(+)